jgi:hypothetical protein
MQRFSGWPPATTITVVPDSPSSIRVGDFTLEEGQDTIWVRVASFEDGNPCSWPWSYGLFYWRSSDGRELGSCKVFGSAETEVFKLGVGRPPLQRSGSFYFEPRFYNLAWVQKGNPWTIQFQALAGVTSGGGTGDDRPSAVAGVIADLVDAGVRWIIKDGVAYLLLSPIR